MLPWWAIFKGPGPQQTGRDPFPVGPEGRGAGFDRCRQVASVFFLDGVHVRIGQAEMVPDLMHDHMGHHVLDRDAAPCLFVQQRAPEQGDHAWQIAGRPDRMLTEGPTVVQAKQRPGIRQADRPQHVVFGKILNAKNHIAKTVAEHRRKRLDGSMCKSLQRGNIGRVGRVCHDTDMGRPSAIVRSLTPCGPDRPSHRAVVPMAARFRRSRPHQQAGTAER